MTKTILVVDDEPDYLKLLDYNLTRENYLVLPCKDAEEALKTIEKHTPDLFIIDVMLPGMDGLELCRRIRQDRGTSAIPIILLTAKADEVDKVVGLETGADDYVTKPFSVKELVARVKAALRRGESIRGGGDVIRHGQLCLDAGRRKFFVGAKEVALTRTEFDIVHALMAKKGLVITRDDLLEFARGDEESFLERTIDVHIAAIRKKLKKSADLIETVRGVGYRLRD